MPSAAVQLTTSAFTHLLQSFTPATRKAYNRMFSDFMAFLVSAGLLPSQVNIHVLFAFMEYLCQNEFTPSNISNYFAGIRAFCVIYNIPTNSFRGEKIQMFIKSLKINRPLTIKNTSILTDVMLLNILETTTQLEHPQVFTALYLLTFFSFLRFSNMVPHSFATFDIPRHLARGDIIFSYDMAIILVKWSKTIQGRDKVVFIAQYCLGLGYALLQR